MSSVPDLRERMRSPCGSAPSGTPGDATIDKRFFLLEMAMDPQLEQVTLIHERSVRSLSDRTGASLTHVRALFACEFARLELKATVRAYLPLLTAANVRAMLMTHDFTAPISQRLATSLNRKRRNPLMECPSPARSEPVAPLTLLDRWEDDGGAPVSVRGSSSAANRARSRTS